jgi:hypothetical protein
MKVRIQRPLWDDPKISVIDAAGERIGDRLVRGITAQEGAEIACGRKPETCNSGVLRPVDELINVIGIEAAFETHLTAIRFAGERRGSAVGERPFAVVDRLARIGLMDAPRQNGVRLAA